MSRPAEQTAMNKADAGWWQRILVLAVTFGIFAGIGELALYGVKKFVQHRVLHVSQEIIWMVPLADVALCLVVAVLFIALAAGIPRLRGVRTAVSVTAFPAVLTILLHYRPLHVAAKAVLAAGLAVQVGVLASKFPRFAAWLAGLFAGRVRVRPLTGGLADAPVFREDRRRFVVGAAAALAGTYLGTRGWIRLRESRAMPDVAAAAGATNVLLIVMDTVRAGSLSLYGYERQTTPLLDAKSGRAIVFERAYSTAPWTLPSHASMFTGHWHHEMSTDWDDPLDATLPTLSEVLGRAGYATAGFVANTAYGSYEHGLERGFARYEDYRHTPDQIVASSALGATLTCGNRNEIGCKLRGPLGWYELVGRKPAGHVRERFANWVDGLDEERPFFAFLNMFDAHAPYLPPSPFAEMFATGSRRGNPMHLDLPGWEWTPEQVAAEQAAYDGAIAYMDQQIDGILQDLEARGRLANTIVIITSDHGEEFMEHGVMTHGNSLYAPSIHVPLIFLLPNGESGEQRVAAPVSVRDIPATIANLLRVQHEFPGRDLTVTWQGGALPEEPIFADVSGRTFRPAHYPVSKGDMRSVVSGDWHFIRRGDGQLELFEVGKDPWERVPRIQTDSTVADSLRRILDAVRRTE